MGSGGRRPGSGRKLGGGIPKTKALRSEARALLAEIVGTERDPLMVAINIAADVTQPVAIRLEAALGASRYLHPTLSAQAIATMPAKGDAAEAVRIVMERINRLSPPPPQTIEMLPSGNDPAG